VGKGGRQCPPKAASAHQTVGEFAEEAFLKLALLYRRRRYGKVRAIIDFPVHLQGDMEKKHIS